MKKSAFLLIPLIIFSFACAQIDDRAKVKPIALKEANDFFKNKSQRENITYEVKEISACVINGPEAVVKIDVIVKNENGTSKKVATVLCEKDIEKGTWQVKNVMLE